MIIVSFLLKSAFIFIDKFLIDNDSNIVYQRLTNTNKKNVLAKKGCSIFADFRNNFLCQYLNYPQLNPIYTHFNLIYSSAKAFYPGLPRIQDRGGHAGSCTGRLVQDWTGLPGVEPSGGSQPIREEISNTAGKMSGEGENRKLQKQKVGTVGTADTGQTTYSWTK